MKSVAAKVTSVHFFSFPVETVVKNGILKQPHMN